VTSKNAPPSVLVGDDWLPPLVLGRFALRALAGEILAFDFLFRLGKGKSSSSIISTSSLEAGVEEGTSDSASSLRAAQGDALINKPVKQAICGPGEGREERVIAPYCKAAPLDP
jgi:hypothetical protein